MLFTARLTADAKVTDLKDNRSVVNFSVAINDRFKTKSGELKEVTEYVRCAYWLGTNVARVLTKGTVVEVTGRMGVDAYLSGEGQPKATLTCHVNSLKVHSTSTAGKAATQQAVAGTNDTPDDLPF